MNIFKKLREQLSKNRQKQEALKAERQAPKFKTSVFHEEFKVLTGSYRKAVILNELIFMHNLQPEWVEVSANELLQKLCFDVNVRTIQRDLVELGEDEFIEIDESGSKWKRNNRYKVQYNFIEKELERIEQLHMLDDLFDDEKCRTDATPCRNTDDTTSHLYNKTVNALNKTTTESVVVPSSKNNSSELSTADKELLNRISKEVPGLKKASSLITTYGRQTVEKQLDLLKERLEISEESGIEIPNLPGYFRASVANNWCPPKRKKATDDANTVNKNVSEWRNKASAFLATLKPGDMLKTLSGNTVKFLETAGPGGISIEFNGQVGNLNLNQLAAMA